MSGSTVKTLMMFGLFCMNVVLVLYILLGGCIGPPSNLDRINTLVLSSYLLHTWSTFVGMFTGAGSDVAGVFWILGALVWLAWVWRYISFRSQSTDPNHIGKAQCSVCFQCCTSCGSSKTAKADKDIQPELQIKQHPTPGVQRTVVHT